MNLYKIEMMKMRLSAYLWAAAGIFASLLALGILFLFLGIYAPEEGIIFTSWNGLAALITAMTFACFSVFSAAVSAKIIVEEYCGKNAVLLFTYPIDRKKILNVKCGIVLCLTVFLAFMCSVLVMGILYITAEIFKIAPRLTSGNIVLNVLVSSFLAGVLSSAVGIFSGALGWKRRSVTAAIVCAVILICLLTNFIAGSPNHMVLVMILMGIVFVLAAAVMYRVLAGAIEGMEV